MAHPLAGERAPAANLIDVGALRAQYANEEPDPEDKTQRVAFGTSGHRGSSTRRSFNEAHILAVTQAICEHRAQAGIEGPLFLGMDTHALSDPAHRTALEVLAANGVTVRIAIEGVPTPTPAISLAILAYNAAHPGEAQADGIVITPSHNPPEDGGFKYNPPNGGPADTDVTSGVEARANELLAKGNAGVKRMTHDAALAASTTSRHDYVAEYVEALGSVIDMDAIRSAGVRIGVDPLGGAGVRFFEPIAKRYGLAITVVNPDIDMTFGFMPCDHDGKIRMDCSSPYAMKNLVVLRDRFDIAFGNDTDADRHGIVTRSKGLLNPNHFLAVAASYLFGHRPGWPQGIGIGKTVVTSGMIDRVGKHLARPVEEFPVGFKWFVKGLAAGTLGFAGEESAGASFLRRDGRAWTTDKDGILLGLLAAEMIATTGKDPGELYDELTGRFGAPAYTRIDQPATAAEKAILKKLSPSAVTADSLAGERILAKLVRSPGNEEPIGGLKVVTENGWFAARPSGTEDVYKIYAESFRGDAHLAQIVDEARAIVALAFAG